MTAPSATSHDATSCAAFPKLRAWIDDAPKLRTQSAIARAIDCGQVAVRNWIMGIQRPTEEYRMALYVLTGIPAEDWVSPREKEGRERRVRLAIQHVARLTPAPIEENATGTDG